MCGWAGFLNQSATNALDMAVQVRRMAGTLAHRGPDDEGIWLDSGAGVALGFRRLAIVDLSAEGHQPMLSASGRYVMVFNGEVYNFSELRQQLEALGHRFRGHSDTEVMLAAIEQWGLQPAVQRFVGMFAFALWDRHEHTLALVRDRLGIKPLYYGWMGNTLLFGSELKALRAHPRFRAEIDRGALMVFLSHGYVRSPASIYKDISQLQPGCILTIHAAEPDRPMSQAYWSAQEIAEEGAAHPLTCAAHEAMEQLEALLRDAVRLRMIADVPLGAFLSGGVDSSTVVALMQTQSTQAVKTFSIGFEEAAYDEARYAQAVANHLGTDHTELYVTSAQARAIIPRLPVIYDEPFADPSQIPTFLLSELARRHVTVSLSGDGGDELFGGYSRYFVAAAAWRKLRLIPPPLRRALHASAATLRSLSASHSSLHTSLERLTRIGAMRTADDVYRYVASQWKAPGEVVIGGYELDASIINGYHAVRLSDFLQRMMFFDTVTYLPDDILTKVDRASMAVSLEARVPLLDHRVVEFAWRLPLSMKIQNQQSKWIVRQLLYRYVPRQLIERPKMGFGVPLDVWLRGPLRAWADSLLDARRLRDEGFFRPEPIRSRWEDHLMDRRNQGFYLWNVLMFQAWFDHWRNHDASAAVAAPPQNTAA